MFKIGDRVRVIKKEPSNLIWEEAMDKTVGSVGAVVMICDYYTQKKAYPMILVSFGSISETWGYDPASLAPLSEPSPVLEPGAYLAILKSLKK